jgi:hypothetical protein
VADGPQRNTTGHVRTISRTVLDLEHDSSIPFRPIREDNVSTTRGLVPSKECDAERD